MFAADSQLRIWLNVSFHTSFLPNPLSRSLINLGQGIYLVLVEFELSIRERLKSILYSIMNYPAASGRGIGPLK